MNNFMTRLQSKPPLALPPATIVELLPQCELNFISKIPLEYQVTSSGTTYSLSTDTETFLLVVSESFTTVQCECFQLLADMAADDTFAKYASPMCLFLLPFAAPGVHSLRSVVKTLTWEESAEQITSFALKTARECNVLGFDQLIAVLVQFASQLFDKQKLNAFCVITDVVLQFLVKASFDQLVELSSAKMLSGALISSYSQSTTLTEEVLIDIVSILAFLKPESRTASSFASVIALSDLQKSVFEAAMGSKTPARQAKGDVADVLLKVYKALTNADSKWANGCNELELGAMILYFVKKTSKDELVQKVFEQEIDCAVLVRFEQQVMNLGRKIENASIKLCSDVIRIIRPLIQQQDNTICTDRLQFGMINLENLKNLPEVICINMIKCIEDKNLDVKQIDFDKLGNFLVTLAECQIYIMKENLKIILLFILQHKNDAIMILARSKILNGIIEDQKLLVYAAIEKQIDRQVIKNAIGFVAYAFREDEVVQNILKRCRFNVSNIHNDLSFNEQIKFQQLRLITHLVDSLFDGIRNHIMYSRSSSQEDDTQETMYINLIGSGFKCSFVIAQNQFDNTYLQKVINRIDSFLFENISLQDTAQNVKEALLCAIDLFLSDVMIQFRDQIHYSSLQTYFQSKFLQMNLSDDCKQYISNHFTEKNRNIPQELMYLCNFVEQSDIRYCFELIQSCFYENVVYWQILQSLHKIDEEKSEWSQYDYKNQLFGVTLSIVNIVIQFSEKQLEQQSQQSLNSIISQLSSRYCDVFSKLLIEMFLNMLSSCQKATINDYEKNAKILSMLQNDQNEQLSIAQAMLQFFDNYELTSNFCNATTAENMQNDERVVSIMNLLLFCGPRESQYEVEVPAFKITCASQQFSFDRPLDFVNHFYEYLSGSIPLIEMYSGYVRYCGRPLFASRVQCLTISEEQEQRLLAFLALYYLQARWEQIPQIHNGITGLRSPRGVHISEYLAEFVTLLQISLQNKLAVAAAFCARCSAAFERACGAYKSELHPLITQAAPDGATQLAVSLMCGKEAAELAASAERAFSYFPGKAKFQSLGGYAGEAAGNGLIAGHSVRDAVNFPRDCGLRSFGKTTDTMEVTCTFSLQWFLLQHKSEFWLAPCRFYMFKDLQGKIMCLMDNMQEKEFETLIEKTRVQEAVFALIFVFDALSDRNNAVDAVKFTKHGVVVDFFPALLANKIHILDKKLAERIYFNEGSYQEFIRRQKYKLLHLISQLIGVDAFEESLHKASENLLNKAFDSRVLSE